MDLSTLASLLAQAQLVIGTDTGLTHLAGALGTPTLGLYCATDPAATGLYACTRATNRGGINAVPGVSAVIAAVDGLLR
jgi:heptosyltransferase-1